MDRHDFRERLIRAAGDEMDLDALGRQIARRAVLFDDEIGHSMQRSIAKRFAPQRRRLLAGQQIGDAAVARRVAHSKPRRPGQRQTRGKWAGRGWRVASGSADFSSW